MHCAYCWLISIKHYFDAAESLDQRSPRSGVNGVDPLACLSHLTVTRGGRCGWGCGWGVRGEWWLAGSQQGVVFVSGRWRSLRSWTRRCKSIQALARLSDRTRYRQWKTTEFRSTITDHQSYLPAKYKVDCARADVRDNAMFVLPEEYNTIVIDIPWSY